MDALWIMLKNVLMFVAYALPGFILVKSKLLKTNESLALSKILTYVGMPFLILSSTISIDLTSAFIKTAITAVFACFAITFAFFFLTIFLTKNEKQEKKRGVMRFAMTFCNNGFLGIPLAMAVFKDNPFIISVAVVFNIVNNMLLYTVGAYLISGDKSKISFKKALVNPVIISFFIGVILNLTRVTVLIPEVATFSDGIKGIVTPISMMILGIKLANVPIKSLFNSLSVYYVSFIKLIVMPIISVAVGVLLIKVLSLNIDAIYAFFIAFAVPTASLATTFADQFDGDTNASVSCTLGSTILSVITIPVLFYLLNLLIPFIF